MRVADVVCGLAVLFEIVLAFLEIIGTISGSPLIPIVCLGVLAIFFSLSPHRRNLR